MKNNKGFTLIELLVVVAIIGILAAVGTVAYTGYTAGAKKSASKANHAAVVKYIAAEDQKCNIDEAEAMSGNLTCLARDGSTVVAAAVTALADFKNPYSTDNSAVRSTGVSDDAAADMGFVNLVPVDKTITITTCWQNDCAADTAASTTVGEEADAVTNRVENTIEVGE